MHHTGAGRDATVNVNTVRVDADDSMLAYDYGPGLRSWISNPKVTGSNPHGKVPHSSYSQLYYKLL